MVYAIDQRLIARLSGMKNYATIFEIFSSGIGKEMSRAKTQSTPSSEKKKIFYFAPWRLGARIFVEVVLSNIKQLRN